MPDHDLESIAQQLFDAFVAHDLDAVEALLAPDAVLTQNGASRSWAEMRPMIEGIRSVLGDHRYERVRRVVGDGAVVEEHDVVSTTPDGRNLRLAACVVIRVDEVGRITTLDEYVDPTPLMAG